MRNNNKFHLAILAVGITLMSGCTDIKRGVRADDGSQPSYQSRTVSDKLNRIPIEPAGEITANIRRTSYGVPHIVAHDWVSLGFGAGYAFAEDNACLMADQIIRIRSQRSKFFGPDQVKGSGDNANLISDLSLKALHYYRNAEAQFSKLPKQSQALFRGYSAGYNLYVQNREAPWPGNCFVKHATRVSAIDLFAYQLFFAGNSSGAYMAPYIASALGPQPETAQMDLRGLAPVAEQISRPGLGSNGWAIGKNSSSTKGGALLANPHFPTSGNLRFYEQHLIIPGYLNVSGASVAMFPMVHIGFNPHIAWTHTVSYAPRFTLHQLELDPQNPYRYRYEGEYVEMKKEQVTIELPENRSVSRNLYSTVFGPIVSIPGTPLAWTADSAVAFADANQFNPDLVQHWLEINLSDNLEEFKATFQHHSGIPWVNTLYADKAGNAFYIDASVVPHLSQEHLQAIEQNPVAQQLLTQMGLWLLPGNSGKYNWSAQSEPTMPLQQAPRLENTDFVLNANGSPWLINNQKPTPAFPILYGKANERLSLRTRYNFSLVEKAKASSGVSIDEMIQAVYQNGSFLADLIKEDLVSLCHDNSAQPVIIETGKGIDIGPACEALANWDGTVNLSSRGAHLFVEFAEHFKPETMFAHSFDLQAPVTTPNRLATSGPGKTEILMALAKVVDTLKKANIPLGAKLADIQFIELFDLAGNPLKKLPIHGSTHRVGAFNLMEKALNGYGNGTLFPETRRPALSTSGLTAEGYPIRHGSSWLMTVAFDENGPTAKGVNIFSQSTDFQSKHFSDQYALFRGKKVRPILHTEAQIAADTNLVEYDVSAPYTYTNATTIDKSQSQ